MPSGALYRRFSNLSVYFLSIRICIRNFVTNNIVMKSEFLYREMECEGSFLQKGQFWHLFTPGNCQEIIFKNDDDFKFGMTSSAMSLTDVVASGRPLKLYAFALMSNHVHNLLCGSEEDCNEYFNLWKSRLLRYFAGKVDLSKFNCQLIPVETLKSFRYEVAYINRNGFVHNKKEIPFSYEWSSGRYHFNPVTREIPLTGIKNLNCREKKTLFKSRMSNLYDSLMTSKGYISPLSFCEIEDGEDLYNSPHQYFNLLYKSVEEHSLIAKRIGDSIFLNDNEMLSIVYKRSKDLYKVDDPKLLKPDDKVEMAKFMHHEYNASNGQIQRMLKIDKYIVESLFPKAR